MRKARKIRARSTLAIRLPVVPLRPTNLETAEPQPFAALRMSPRRSMRIALARLPKAALPASSTEGRPQHKYPAQAPALVPQQPHAQSGDAPKTPGLLCSSARRLHGLRTKAASPGDWSHGAEEMPGNRLASQAERGF